MKARHHLSRIALVLAVAAVSAPVSQASNPDDWFRDAGAIRPGLTTAPSSGLVDDWFRSAGLTRALAGTASSSVAVDDYFRNGSVRAVSTPQTPVAVDDYFRGAPSIAKAARPSPVAVDDYFRTPVLVPAGGSGLDWGDAGIGAASGFGLALAVAGLGLLALRRRTDEAKTGTAATVPS